MNSLANRYTSNISVLYVVFDTKSKIERVILLLTDCHRPLIFYSLDPTHVLMNTRGRPASFY